MFERYQKPNSSFAYVKFTNTINDEVVLEFINYLGQQAKGQKTLLEVFNLREISSDSNVSFQCCMDLGDAIQKYQDLFYISGKIAFLVDDSFQLNLARAFISMTSNVTVKREMEIFYTLHEAVDFLDTEESLDDILKFMVDSGEYEVLDEDLPS